MSATAYVVSNNTVRVLSAKGAQLDAVYYSGGADNARKALTEQGYVLAEGWDWTDNYGGALAVAVTR